MNKLSDAIAILSVEVNFNDNVKAKALLSDLAYIYKSVGEKPISFVNNQLTNDEYATLIEAKNNLAA